MNVTNPESKESLAVPRFFLSSWYIRKQNNNWGPKQGKIDFEPVESGIAGFQVDDLRVEGGSTIKYSPAFKTVFPLYLKSLLLLRRFHRLRPPVSLDSLRVRVLIVWFPTRNIDDDHKNEVLYIKDNVSVLVFCTYAPFANKLGPTNLIVRLIDIGKSLRVGLKNLRYRL